jgi:hypothetical protein
MSELSIAVRI